MWWVPQWVPVFVPRLEVLAKASEVEQGLGDHASQESFEAFFAEASSQGWQGQEEEPPGAVRRREASAGAFVEVAKQEQLDMGPWHQQWCHRLHQPRQGCRPEARLVDQWPSEGS